MTHKVVQGKVVSKKMLELINQFSNVASYKINILNSKFLYTYETNKNNTK